jgi:hypothetical protein
MPASPRASTTAGAFGPAGAIGAGVLLVGLLAIGWAGLWADAPAGRLALVAGAALVPAVVRSLRLRLGTAWTLASAALAAVVALGAAAGSDPVRVVGGDGATWTRLRAVIPEGIGNAATTPLPLDPTGGGALSGLLILILWCACLLIAWQAIVGRRPLAAVIATMIGLAYRWTLVPPGRPVVAGTAALVVALVALRLATPRRGRRPGGAPGRAVAVGTVVALVALAGSAAAGGTSNPWWNWQNWTFGTGRGTTTLDVSQRYGPLIYPDSPIVIMRVAASTPVPLKAVVLEDFDGSSFTQAQQFTPKRRETGDIALPADTAGRPTTLTQRITLTGTRTSWVLAGGRPVTVRGLGGRSVARSPDGSVRIDPAIGPGETYQVDSLVPDPGVNALLASGPYTGAVDPRLLRMSPGGGLPAVVAPLWGSTAPRPTADEFGQYGGLYRLSRRVIGDARTPYAAVNRIEAYLRGPGFDYDPLTPHPIGTPDLVDFALVTHRGYCQHFAGAMALMLRMNGIPARVAVGFTSDPGRFDITKNTYEVIDRDAHSWVEVLFPGSGWLPFDPTPGRSVPNRASVSSPNYSTAGLDRASAPQVSPEAVRPSAPTPAPRPEPGVPAGGAGGAGTGTGPWLAGLVGLLALAALAPFTLKAVRRARRRHGDERARVLGAARELESFALDAGLPLDPALAPTERADVLWRRLGIDAGRIYGLASTARFAPSDPPPGSGREAWTELARARRRLGWRRRAMAGLRLRSLRR